MVNIPNPFRPEYTELAHKYVDEIVAETARDRVPTVAGFACSIKQHKQRLYEWAKIYPEFGDAIARIGTEQERILIEKGCAGSFHPRITALMLAAHGYSEKRDVAVTSPDGSMSPRGSNPEEVAAAVAAVVKAL